MAARANRNLPDGLPRRRRRVLPGARFGIEGIADCASKRVLAPPPQGTMQVDRSDSRLTLARSGRGFGHALLLTNSDSRQNY